jgi:hypothetical protein
MTSPFSQWSWVIAPSAPMIAMARQMKSSGHIRLPRFL